MTTLRIMAGMLRVARPGAAARAAVDKPVHDSWPHTGVCCRHLTVGVAERSGNDLAGTQGRVQGGGVTSWQGRIGPWLTPILLAIEVALVWSGVLTLLNAVLIVVVVELVLATTVLSRGAVAVGRFRAARSDGRDAWAAAEDALGRMVPGRAARVLFVEARMWVCLLRWVTRRGPAGHTFGYGRAMRPLLWVSLVLVIVEGVVVEMILAAVLGTGSPWVWLALGLHCYGLVWLGGFLGSLRVLPHEVDGYRVRLRDSVFTEISIPLTAVVSVAEHLCPNQGRSGLRVDQAGHALLAYGDATVRLHLTPEAGALIAGNPAGHLRTLDVTVDEPAEFAATVSARTHTIR